MPVLTKEQIDKLSKIIQKHVTWITWRIFGTDYVSDKEIDRLKAEGLLPTDVQTSSIKYAFVLGKLESLLKEAEWKDLSWEDLKEAAEARHTEVEKLQIQASELSAYTVLRGLEDDIRDRVFTDISNATQEAIDEAYIKDVVKEEVKTGVEYSKTMSEVSEKLYQRTGDLKRDWNRVAITEMHAARQNGVVSAIVNKVDVYKHGDGEDSQVSVVPDPRACDDCLRLYTEGGNPKIFKLSELLGNSGTNYIRPWRANAKPVIPPLHPSCYCRLRYLPKGWGWENKKMVLKDPGKIVERARAKMSSVKKSIEILKVNPHQLLDSSKEVSMPTEADVDNAGSVEDLEDLLTKLQVLRKMHIDDEELHNQLEDLANRAIHRAITMRKEGASYE
jgi:hypothetical protein